MASNSRLSTAAQFYMNDDNDNENKMSTYDRVVELLNKASLMEKQVDKVKNLRMVQELIVHKEPNLLDNFLDEMLAFQNDRSQEARKFVVSFIEEASKKDPDILPRVIGNLTMMLQDDSVQVAKKTIMCMGQIYRIALKWVALAKTIHSDMKQTWQYMQQLKSKIAEMLEVHNEGVRFHTVKFIECVVTALSWKTNNSELPKGVNDVSLDIVPENHTLLKVKKLEEEGKQLFDILIAYQASSDISSTNLMTSMSSLVLIARMRPGFMSQVFQSLETLHVNLPPTLAKSQVTSVRKNLKMQFLYMLKHPSAVEFQSNLTTLLTDLGASQSEVMKALPSRKDGKRKALPRNDSDQSFKKPKQAVDQTPIREDDDDYLMTPFVSLSGEKKKPSAKPVIKPPEKKSTAIDITTEDLVPRLTPQNVADLVLLSMVMLPEQMPASFQATYTPIAAAGTEAQINHLARLLATQLTAAGLGKGAAEEKLKLKEEEDVEEEDIEVDTSPKHSIRTLVGGSVGGKEEEETVVAPMPPPAPLPSRRPGIPIRAFKLSAVTKPMEKSDIEKQARAAFLRILKLEKQSLLGNMSSARAKILVTLVTQFGGPLKDELEQFIFEDLRNREELALMWIYQEYANSQGYNISNMQLGMQDKASLEGYDQCLARILNGVLNRPDQKEGLFGKLLMESPSITTNAIQILKKYCQEEGRITLGMGVLKELIVKRPCMQLEFLDVLLDFTSHEKSEVRNTAIRVTKKLHDRSDLKDPVERYALYHLKLLQQDTPPGELFGPGKGRTEPVYSWNEDIMKLCLYLYLGLLPVNHKLIHELANVYTSTTADIKRTILRVLETPVKGMGMHSPELLTLLETCPKGAETLITRIIHILTDRATPSPELVERVRDLYHKRVSDVRFLIPVLTGLTKKEVIAALPKLIKLNPVVVKEVFNRLLGVQDVGSDYKSPVTPVELLIALHNIDLTKCDMKTVIQATNLCFGERNVYTQEVLTVVMKRLMEFTPLPTLLMRTVLQSLAMYPKLIALVLSILQKLVTKQVWKQKKVWEGFVKCCQRTRPHCFALLLQLPPPQLKSAFEIAADLREPLYNHVQSFTPHQRAHIPKPIIQILEKEAVQETVVIKVEDSTEKVRIKIAPERAERVSEKHLQIKIKEEPMDSDSPRVVTSILTETTG